MPTTLAPGDIAIIGFNADNPDRFAFAFLTDIDAGTEVLFSDHGVRQDGTFRQTEGVVRYTAPVALQAGTIVTFTGVGGDFAEVDGGFDLSVSGDQITAFQGSADAPTYLFAVMSNSTEFQTGSDDSNQSDLPPGLVVGQTAVAAGAGSGAESEFDNIAYSGPTSGTRADLLAAIADAGDWIGSDQPLSLPSGDLTVTEGGSGGGEEPTPGTRYIESFEAEPGTTYTLQSPFDAGFSYFGRFASPDDGNAARDDFQTGFDGDFAIHSQDNDAAGEAARTIAIADVNILGSPIVTVSLAALNSEPAFNNYEATQGDGIRIFAAVDDGARTLIGEFAPNATGQSDLYLDTDGDGIGDGPNLTTNLLPFTFDLPGTGETVDIEIELTSTDSFEPLVVDTVIVEDEFVVLNEVIYRAVDGGASEFIELHGTPNLSLAGLSVIQVAVDGTILFRQDLGAGDAIGPNGFFLLGNASGLGGRGVTPDIDIGPDEALFGDAATFALVRTAGLADVGAPLGGGVSVVDAVGFTDPSSQNETFPLDPPLVGPDGTFPPAGGRRVADGVDTDAASDWTLNSFFLDDITPTSGVVDQGGGPAIDATIMEIQGSGEVSSLDGQTVRTTGIVTAVDGNGFYLQDADGDGDTATSDGIFVFTGSAPGVSAGDGVEVTGSVLEFGGASDLPLTEITNPSRIDVVSTGNALPAAVVIGQGGRVQPTDSIANGIQFWESLEGMRVEVNAPVAVSPSDGGTLYVVADGGANAPSLSSRGTNNNGPADFNPEKIKLFADGDLVSNGMPQVDVGTALETVTGVVGYFGEYEVKATEALAVAAPSTLTQETTALTGQGDVLSVASYNVLNLDPGDPQAKFDALALQIIDNLQTPDIIGLQEVQDNSGPTDDGVIAADETLQKLVDAIAGNGGPAYSFVDNIFITDNLSGGQPGANIRTAFLYDPARVEALVVEAVGDQAEGSAFAGARLPLSVSFSFQQETVTVISNHFSSKGGSVPLFGATQPTDFGQEDPSINGSLNERREQAQAVNDYVDTILATDADANIIVLGDLNEFEFISPLAILSGEAVSTDDGFGFESRALEDAILTNLTDTLPEDEAYTFIFEGTSQALDHILVTNNLAARAAYDIVHTNVEFLGDEASDHDPVVATIDFGPEAPGIFTLELLHLADQEAGEDAITDAPNASAVMQALENQDLGNDGRADNTIRLSSGDAIIPGLFFTASEAAFGGAGRADILIQNELGFEAIALGNHEFDLGTGFLADLIDGDPAEGYVDAQFPYLSANLDFSTDPNLAPLVTPDGEAPLPNTIAGSVVIERGGERIGVIGSTTPNVAEISSPGDVTIEPFEFDRSTFSEAQLAALVAEIQTDIDALVADGINKIVLMSHYQVFANEMHIAELLSGVDVIIGGGSNSILVDENDPLRADNDPGDVDGDYPIFMTDAVGNPVAIVNTDGNYRYVGRLVIDFDEDGIIIPESYDPEVSGAYATDDAGVAALGAEGLVDPEIQEIVDAIGEQVDALKETVIGYTDVYLDGRRGSVRTEETNMGNLTADANLAYAKAVDPTVQVSLKNGGGIRNDIGDPATDAPPAGGGITIADHLNVLQFNNSLTLLTLTAEQLVRALEHAVSDTADGNEPGRFAQVAGVNFSFDATRPDGERVVDARFVDEDGDTIAALVEDGALADGAPAAIRVVTLGFLADGGDGYPYPDFILEDPAFADVQELLSDQGLRTGDATFAVDGSEQDALAEYLLDNFATPETAFAEAETGVLGDTRVQQVVVGTDGSDDLVGTAFAELITSGGGRNDKIAGGGGVDAFHFTFEELANGMAERNTIGDFDGAAGEAIILETDDFSVRFGSRSALITAGPDGDRIYVKGSFDSIDDLNIVTEPFADIA